MINPVRSLHSWGVGARSPTRRAADRPVDAPAALRKAFDDHARFVWRALLSLGVAEADVADASQQVFLVLHDRLADLVEGTALRTFIYGICLRVASDFRRRAHRRRERLAADPPARTTTVSPEQQAAGREALRALEAALDQLPSAQREVFVLYEIEELPMNEIASALACPLPTAYSRLRLARRSVLERLAVHLDGEEAT